MPKKRAQANGNDPQLDRIRLDPHNYRKHGDRNKELIRHSLELHGAGRSILADGDGIVRAGNGVYEEALALGMKIKVVEGQPDTLIVVQRPDLRGQAAEEMGLLDNRTTETSEWDHVRLAELEKREAGVLERLRMFSASEVEAIKRRAEAEQGDLQKERAETVKEHADNLEAVQAKWGVKVGDRFYILSRNLPGQSHVVVCGDCLKSSVLVAAGFENLNGVFTSPPYADRRSEFYESLPVNKYLPWWGKVQSRMAGALASDGSFFVNIKPHAADGQRVLYVFDLVLQMVREWGWAFIDELCWLKNPFPADFHTRFKNGFEPVYHFSRTTSPKIRRQNVAQYSETAFTGDGRQMSWGSGKSYVRGVVQESGLVYPSNVVKVAGQTGGHAAAFPIGLPGFFVQAYSDPGDRWGDPFLGSGTTLLACEAHARLGHGIELKPEYVALALERCVEAGLEVSRA